ncbi:MAG: hypothetical protein AB7L41_16135, partial [Flavobacteriaceae bacterium]
MLIAVTACLAMAAAAALLLHPRVRGSDYWRAMATPLASIIGSGFLVSVPLMRELAGNWAIAAMALLLVLTWLIGAAIRFNIAHVEPLAGDGRAPKDIAALEWLSHAVLAFAYFVSVAYYLVLFASFLLKGAGVDSLFLVKAIVTVILAAIGALGWLRGFRGVERVEIYAVTLKLAVIAGMIGALLVFDAGRLAGGLALADLAPRTDLKGLQMLMGLLIIVQGFETSRFLGQTYSAELRIRTMKAAQLAAGAIYLVFIACMLPLFAVDAGSDGVAAIVDMLGPVSALLPPIVIVGALASQSSAAIADSNGAAGLIHDISGRRIAVGQTYPLIALIAALVTWETDVFGLITFASRCFA